MEDRLFGLKAEKVKDGPDGDSFAYSGALIEVGQREEDGKSISAPVVREADAIALSRAEDESRSYRPKIGSWPWRVYEALSAIRARDGAQMVPEIVVEKSGYRGQITSAPPPNQVEGLRRDELVEFLDAKYWAESEAPSSDAARPTGTVDGKHRSNRNRGIKDLESRGMVRVFDGWIWLEHQ